MKKGGARPLRPELLWALAPVLFLAAAPHMANVAPGISLFFGIMMLLRLAASWRPRLLPGKPLLLVAAFAGFGNVFLHYPLLFGRRAGVALLVSMLALKLLESRTQRDLYVGIFLGYFLLTTLFLFNQTFGLALYALIVVVGLTGLMVEASRREGSASPIPALRRSGILVAQALPIAVALFFFFPRLSSPLWEIGYETPTASTGISDTLSPGSISNLIRSESVAFRADFEGETPAPEKRYWRGPVFWQTDGREWRDGRALQQPFASPVETADIVSYRVILEPTDQPWLFALDVPLSAPPRAHLTGDFKIVRDQSKNRRSSYRAQSALRYNTGALHPFDRRYGLQLPDTITDKMEALVAEWRRESRSDLEVVNKALSWFREEPFYYTLSPPILEQNPADQFLFETRRGFCEHYATSFVLLMRIAGIPSRVIGGYQGGEMNPVGNYLTVRQSDAHAWSEVWLEGRGWIRVDPTAAVAPQRVERSFSVDRDQFDGVAGTPVNFQRVPGILDQLRKAIDWSVDALGTTWHRWILGYTSGQQRKFLEMLGLDFLQGRRLAFGMVAVTGVVVAGLVALVWVRTRPRVDKIQSAYQRFCRKMARTGLVRRPTEGPLDYAERIMSGRPDLSEEIGAITRLYVKLRYDREAPEDAASRFLRLIRRFRPAKRREEDFFAGAKDGG